MMREVARVGAGGEGRDADLPLAQRRRGAEREDIETEFGNDKYG